jgi:hypothetical protein
MRKGQEQAVDQSLGRNEMAAQVHLTPICRTYVVIHSDVRNSGAAQPVNAASARSPGPRMAIALFSGRSPDGF